MTRTTTTSTSALFLVSLGFLALLSVRACASLVLMHALFRHEHGRVVDTGALKSYLNSHSRVVSAVDLDGAVANSLFEVTAVGDDTFAESDVVALAIEGTFSEVSGVHVAAAAAAADPVTTPTPADPVTTTTEVTPTPTPTPAPTTTEVTPTPTSTSG